ncbi:MAG: pyridoxamine 5'-phosphate oxidase family protein [Candidatus Hydrothermarchaeota archaeon]
MAKMPKMVMDLFNDPHSYKALATSTRDGVPNVSPKHSIVALDEETLAFADIFGSKTNRNLEENMRVAAVAWKMPPVGYQVKGLFEGFKTSGPAFENLSKRIKEAINLDINAVGFIRVEEVYSVAPPDAGKKID